MIPIRIQRSRKHKQVSPNGLPIVYVGRPTKYGNEWTIKAGRTREQCIELYQKTIESWKLEVKEKLIEELKGKNLSCWCPLNLPCHADVLLKLATHNPQLPHPPNKKKLMSHGHVYLYNKAETVKCVYYDCPTTRQQILDKWKVLYAKKMESCWIQIAPITHDRCNEDGTNYRGRVKLYVDKVFKDIKTTVYDNENRLP